MKQSKHTDVEAVETEFNKLNTMISDLTDRLSTFEKGNLDNGVS